MPLIPKRLPFFSPFSYLLGLFNPTHSNQSEILVLIEEYRIDDRKENDREMHIAIADLKRLNEIREWEQDSFFERYKQLKIYYDYLAQTYHYDSKTHTVNPATGEIVNTRSDNTYFDKMTK